MPLKSHPLVFVYGTLKRGFHNHSVMCRARGEFVCRGETVLHFPLVVDGLPYLLNTPGKGHQVEGEIYRVDSVDGWCTLDRLEGHPSFYERRLIEIAGADGETYAAWVYFLARTDERLASLPPVRAYGGAVGVPTE
jgi:gamma-glutamylaminecyclotransferase